MISAGPGRPDPRLGPRDHEHHPSHTAAGEATDSAQVPWAGRDLSPSGFETDTGAADVHLRALLAASDTPDQALFAALAGARLLVPVVAEPVTVEERQGLVHDTSVDMAVVTLTAPDGRRALPLFTGIDSLGAWDSQARPVPVTAQRSAQAAVTERCDVLLIDLAGPAPRVIRSSMLWALAQHADWLPAHEDPHVLAAFDAAVHDEPRLTAFELGGGPDGELRVTLTLVPGLDSPTVTAMLTALGERIATDGEVRARIDALTFALR